MLQLLCVAALTASVSSQQPADAQVVRALESWLRSYRQGDVEFHGRGIARDSIAIKFGILPSGPIGRFTPAQELELLLEHAARLNNAETVELVLAVAGTGLDRFAYTFVMSPGLVRAYGERFLWEFSSDEAWDRVASLAQGKERSPQRGLRTSVQAAALRALGGRGIASGSTLEAKLAASDVPLRLAAAEGLRRMAVVQSVEALARALASEQEEAVIIAEVEALQASLPRQSGEELPPSANLAVRAVIANLGRSWRADVVAVDFLNRFRSADAVPALIGLLESFHSRNPSAERLSGLLQHRVHETLVSLTGARISMNDPEQWREFWDRERSNLQILVPRPDSQQGSTVSGGFFGIPVQGSRALFILDISGSMADPVLVDETVSGGNPGGATETKLDRAKRELLNAVSEISESTSFNLILFSDRISSWNSRLVKATRTNKRRFEQFVDGLNVASSTNLWGGLQEGLEFKSLVYGDLYDSNIDEVFLLSDGAPTEGEVVDPSEILSLIQESYRFNKVRINTVFISSPQDRRPRGRGRRFSMTGPEVLMRRIAETTGGTFVSK